MSKISKYFFRIFILQNKLIMFFLKKKKEKKNIERKKKTLQIQKDLKSIKMKMRLLYANKNSLEKLVMKYKK